MSDAYTPHNFDRNIWGLIIHEPLTKARADWFISKIIARMEHERQTFVDDGFGSAVSIVCPQCKGETMQADLPMADSCPECFGYRGFHTDYCSHNPASR